MTTIDSLTVAIEADTRGLQRELRVADSAIARFATRVRKELGDTNARFASLAGGLSASFDLGLSGNALPATGIRAEGRLGLQSLFEETGQATAGLGRLVDTTLGQMNRSLGILAETVGVKLGRALQGNAKSWQDWVAVAIDSLGALLRGFEGLGSLSGSLGGTGGGPLGGLLDLFGGLFNSGALSLPFGGARQAGGPVTPGRAFLVGERGPELFVPDLAGQIIGAQRNGSGRGGDAGGVTQIYNIDARGAAPGSEQRILAALRQLDRSIEPRAVAAVVGRADRGGAVAQRLGRRSL